jgi:hypothetical protein
MKRRNKILSTYLPAVNPIASPRLENNRLAFENAAVAADVAQAPTSYRAAWFAFDNATGDSRRPLSETTSPTPGGPSHLRVVRQLDQLIQHCCYARDEDGAPERMEEWTPRKVRQRCSGARREPGGCRDGDEEIDFGLRQLPVVEQHWQIQYDGSAREAHRAPQEWTALPP